MNDLDLCLEVTLVMSTIESHSPLNRGLSRKSLEIAAWFRGVSRDRWRHSWRCYL